jgi:hypothetical protein
MGTIDGGWAQKSPEAARDPKMARVRTSAGQSHIESHMAPEERLDRHRRGHLGRPEHGDPIA